MHTKIVPEIVHSDLLTSKFICSHLYQLSVICIICIFYRKVFLTTGIIIELLFHLQDNQYQG